MPFNLYDAIVAGLWGTAVMTAILMLSLAMRITHMDFAKLLGGMVLPLGRGAQTLGLVIHFAFGVAFALVYAWVFALVDLYPSLWAPFWGAIFGLYHFAISMPLVSIARYFNPHVKRGEEADPGAWGHRFGPQEAIVWLIGHVFYGAVVGFAYFTVAALTGTADGTAVPNDFGLNLVVALAVSVGVIALYVLRLNVHEEEGYNFLSAAPDFDREAERQRLRLRYERGEISWDEYQHLRRQYGAEP